MGLQALRGTTDLLAEEVKRWSAVEHTVRRLARLYGYQELRTPVIEDAALFQRSVGETTDIVQKEMFRFADRGGHEIVLRPEGTAAVVRAYLEHNLHKTEGFAKLWYLGPMFRAERPQAGRFRQFHQFGAEAIGSSSPWVDAEVIAFCVETLKACGLTTPTLWLSSMGCRADQQASAQQLRKRLTPRRKQLCQDCQSRFDKNVFRVLDCKNPTCHALAWDTDRSPFGLCAECQAHFDRVRATLTQVGIAFDDTKVFARGLDYYTRTVFEVHAEGLGAQDAVAAGGRYDHLVEELGGPSVGAVGFAAGIERLLMAADKHRPAMAQAPRRQGVYLAVAPARAARSTSLRAASRVVSRDAASAAGGQPTLLGEGFRVVQQLRHHGVCATMDYDQKSLKAQLREADKAGCQFVAILGEAELKQRAITLKDLEQGSQRTVNLDVFIDEMAREMQPTCH